MICETDDYTPYRMEVEETSPSNRKPVNLDDLQQTFDLSTQNSTTQNQIAHSDPRCSGFEEEIENDSSDFGVSYPKEPIYMIEKLRCAIKTGQICNTFEDDEAHFNEQIFEQTSSRDTEEEKVEGAGEYFNESEPAAVTEPVNMIYHALENENMTQLLNSPVQIVQDFVKIDSASEKKTVKKRVKHSVDDGKIHDLNCLPQELSFPQAPTPARTIPEMVMDEDLKRTAYRDHIPLVSKAVLKYFSKEKNFKKELVRIWQQNDISVNRASMYLENRIKGKKEGLLTKNGTPLQQAKIANEKDVLGLLCINGNNDPLGEDKYSAILAFELFFENGFYEHWVEEQYSRIWLKKGIVQADKIRRAFLIYKADASYSFLKYRP